MGAVISKESEDYNCISKIYLILSAINTIMCAIIVYFGILYVEQLFNE
jgi:hypothetical protein